MKVNWGEVAFVVCGAAVLIALIVFSFGGDHNHTVRCPNGVEVTREESWKPNPEEVREICLAGASEEP